MDQSDIERERKYIAYLTNKFKKGHPSHLKWLKLNINSLNILRSIESKLIEEGYFDSLQDSASKRQLEEIQRFQKVRKTRVN